MKTVVTAVVAAGMIASGMGLSMMVQAESSCARETPGCLQAEVTNSDVNTEVEEAAGYEWSDDLKLD